MMEIDTDNLVLKSDGIWYCRSGSDTPMDISYPSDGYSRCFDVEDASFWFRHRNRCILAAVNAFPPSGNGVIYDIGGGNGYVAAGLVSAGVQVVLVEPGRQGAANARKRGLEHVICATTDSAGFRKGSLSNIGLFDVLEHIKGDHSFLASLASLMSPEGMLYLSVPAHDLLWSDADVSAGHYRRYSQSGISAVVQNAGFEIVFTTYFFQALLLPILLSRSIPFRLRQLLHLRSRPVCPKSAARDHVARSPRLASLIDRVLISEPRKINSAALVRFGASCLVVAKKSQSVKGSVDII